MSEQRRIELEVEVPGTPEEVWEAIATGPGITAWFMPADVEPRVGGRIVHRHEADTETPGTVTAYDRPRRFAYEESGWADGELAGDLTATEYLVEARAGGTCVVRLTMSGFGDGEQWDRAIESFAAGWRQALLSLRLYMTHFPGEVAAAVAAGDMVAGPKRHAWEELVRALGLPDSPAAGDRVTTAADAPPLAGVVERAEERMVTLLLDEPARGIGFVGTGGPGDQVYTFVRAQLFGPDAETLAAEQQRRWADWFAGRR